ncbi:hypothetical protein QBC35DRAFT_196375 [Podospora australis]|uniref:Uncharacterized protein n=1 Tax=Podospora australis TaxID=1536484 RepID=A0AAN7AIH2_9PEZI|nr:hypothetical protein QBC35DRAFT_196375 [Podospora australis]
MEDGNNNHAVSAQDSTGDAESIAYKDTTPRRSSRIMKILEKQADLVRGDVVDKIGSSGRSRTPSKKKMCRVNSMDIAPEEMAPPTKRQPFPFAPIKPSSSSPLSTTKPPLVIDPILLNWPSSTGLSHPSNSAMPPPPPFGPPSGSPAQKSNGETANTSVPSRPPPMAFPMEFSMPMPPLQYQQPAQHPQPIQLQRVQPRPLQAQHVQPMHTFQQFVPGRPQPPQWPGMAAHQQVPRSYRHVNPQLLGSRQQQLSQQPQQSQYRVSGIVQPPVISPNNPSAAGRVNGHSASVPGGGSNMVAQNQNVPGNGMNAGNPNGQAINPALAAAVNERNMAVLNMDPYC